MARTTNVVTSLISGGKSAENVTVNSTSWSTDNGTITLSATVPATVNIGDVITDSSANSYLITGISGSDLTCQDFDTATDPATGSATIQEAYQSIASWAADLDTTVLYSSGDTAKGEMYSSGGNFAETGVVISPSVVSTLTVILGKATGQSPKVVPTVTGTNVISVTSGYKVSLQDFELDVNDQAHTRGIYILISSGTGIYYVQRIKVHNCSSIAVGIHISGSSGNFITVRNCLVYDLQRNSTSTIRGIEGLNSSGGTARLINNTVYNIINTGTGQAYGINFASDYAGNLQKNNISMDNEHQDFGSYSNVLTSNNLSSDASGEIPNISTASLFADAAAEDFQLINNSKAQAAGVGLLAGVFSSDPNDTEMGLDLNNFDREQFNGALPWDLGAYQYVLTPPNQAAFSINKYVGRFSATSNLQLVRR